MKKIILLFLIAVTSFLLFAYIDEYENLVLPLFNTPTEDRTFAKFKNETVSDIKDAIYDFNENLTVAYIAADPSLLNIKLIDNQLRNIIAEDIRYLIKERRVMELRVREIDISEIKQTLNGLMQVRTREAISLRYLNLLDNGKEQIPSLEEHEVNYLLKRTGDVWRIYSVETQSSKVKSDTY